ncbi:MAG: hypothetical protein RQ866_04270 [Bacteroidales bacterium]|nr:hypothetical protein [Bacteroidales bacterium]
MKRLKIWILLLFLTSQLFGQDYIEYHRTFNRIDEDVLSQNYTAAIERLDSIYLKYDFIYAKHCMKALQICITANDSIKADKWLEKCFKQGIPVWIIRTNEITNKSITYSTTQKTLNDFDSLHSIYLSSVNTNLREKIDSLLTIDQKYTRRVNDGFVLFKPIHWLQWGINNQRQFELLKQIIEAYGYPEERLIGLSNIQDSVAFAKHFTFWGPSELRDSRVQIMLQHCYSTWHKIDFDFKDTLNKNLCNGNMPAFQYAKIIDFMLPDKQKYINNKFWLRDKFCEENCNEIINRNRYSIGLNTSEQEKRNTLIERERRKNKKANAKIMLE